MKPKPGIFWKLPVIFIFVIKQILEEKTYLQKMLSYSISHD
jgi:hypothetical protein